MAGNEIKKVSPFKRSGTTITPRTEGDSLDLGGDLESVEKADVEDLTLGEEGTASSSNFVISLTFLAEGATTYNDGTYFASGQFSTIQEITAADDVVLANGASDFDWATCNVTGGAHDGEAITVLFGILSFTSQGTLESYLTTQLSATSTSCTNFNRTGQVTANGSTSNYTWAIPGYASYAAGSDPGASGYLNYSSGTPSGGTAGALTFYTDEASTKGFFWDDTESEFVFRESVVFEDEAIFGDTVKLDDDVDIEFGDDKDATLGFISSVGITAFSGGNGTAAAGSSIAFLGGAGDTNEDGGNVYAWGGSGDGTGDDGNVILAYNVATTSAVGNVFIGATSLTNLGTSNLMIEGGVLTLKETTTPTADTNYGKIYTKDTDQLYFQDGGGVEHILAQADTNYGEFKVSDNATETVIRGDDEYQALTANVVTGLQNGFTYAAGLLGEVASIADGTGGLIAVTDVGHGLSAGDMITMNGHTDSAYNGIFEVMTVPTANVFTVTATYTATDTGYWQKGASLKVNAGGAGTYKGTWASTGIAASNGQTVDFCPVVNTTPAAAACARRTFSNADYGSFGGTEIVTLAVDDIIWFVMRNTTSDGNVTIRTLDLNLHRL